MDKYGFEISNKEVILHFLQSAVNLQGLYSFNKLYSKFKTIEPPFNYVQSKNNQEDDDQYDQNEYEKYNFGEDL